MVKFSRAVVSHDGALVPPVAHISPEGLAPKIRSHSANTLSGLGGWTPHSEPAADKPSETRAFPQPSSAPSFWITLFPASLRGAGK